MIEALKKQGISNIWINLIKEMYTNLKANIITDKKGELFQIKKGVKQGDPLSPVLFICALEEIFRKLKWEGRGIKINGEYLNNLRFADDIILIAKNEGELNEMLQELNAKGKKAGLQINWNKTKIMSSGHEPSIVVEGINIENTSEIIYLGQLISLEHRTNKEINRRIGIGWKKFWELKDILKGPYRNELKSKIFNSNIIPAITYGSQSWTLTKKEENLINTTQNSMERAMLGIKKRDKIKISKIKEKFRNNLNIVQVARRSKWKWAGHIARLGDDRWTYKIQNWFLKEGRRKGGQRARWRDEITGFISNKNYESVARERLEWRRVEEAYAQNLGPKAYNILHK